MSDYFSLDKGALQAEYDAVYQQYRAFQQKGLALDMSRGKPAPVQLDLSMDMLDIKTVKAADGTDARNYGILEGLPEARRFFAEMLGVKPSEVIAAGNSSLNLMFNIIELAWRKGFCTSKRAWREEPSVKFLCPSPGYDRHFRVTEEFGFELILVPMTPTGPDMDIVEELAKDSSVKGIWCVPKYSNPDGYTYSDDTVRRLASMSTAAKDFTIFGTMLM